MLDSKLISRLVKLIGASGDKLVLPDVETGKAVVIMDLDAYEALLGTEKPATVPDVEPPSKVLEKPEMPGVTAATGTDFESVMVPVDEPVQEPVFSPDSEKPKKSASIAKKPPSKVLEKPVRDDRAQGLTQPGFRAKLHHDIGGWKNAQELERVQELRSAVGELPPVDASDALDEEEQFYLEPIE